MNGEGRHVLRTAQRTVHRLLPTDGDIEKFIEAVADHRGRPIKVVQCPLDADEPSGLWVPLPDEELVLLAQGMTHEHRAAVVCHEIAHMLLGHRARASEADIALIMAALQVSIDPSVAARFFTRHGYEAAMEAEAEALATRMASELGRKASAYAESESLAQDHVSSRLR